MKKKLLIPAGIVLTLAVAYCAASWYTGRQAQAQIYDAVKQINQQLDVSWPAGQARPTLQIQDYQRGWFSSDVRYVFTFSDDSGDIQNLHLDDALQHGPFPWGALGAGEFSPLLAYSRIQLMPTEFVRPWFDARKGASPMQINTQITFGGVARSLWTLHPFTFDGEGGRIDFSGGSVRVDYDRRIKKSDAKGQFDSLKWTDRSGGRGAISNFAVEGHNTVAAQGDIQVHNVVKVERITAQHPDGPEVTIENMAVKLDSARTGVLLDGALAYEFGKIRVGDADLGAIRAGVRAEHINFIALEGLLAAWEQVSADGETLDSDEERQLEAPLRTMLASSPQLTVDPLDWTTSEGRTHAMFAVHFKPVADVATGKTDLGQLIEQSLKQVQLDVSVSRAMVIQLAGQISPEAGEQTRTVAAMLFDQYAASLQQAGLLQVKDEVASLNLSYAGGEVGLGDQRMSVQEFVALVRSVLG